MASFDILISLRATSPATRVREPVSCGIPFPRGALPRSNEYSPGSFRLRDEYGIGIPLQVRTLDRWADGSARWLLCTFPASISGSGTVVLSPGEGKADVCWDSPKVRLNRDTIQRCVTLNGARFVTGEGLSVVDAAGRTFAARPDGEWFLEVDTCVREAGFLTNNGVRFARYTQRTHYFDTSPVVRVHLTITNPNRSEHPGGCWDLGEAGSILIRDASVVFPLAGTGPFAGEASVEVNSPFTPFVGHFEVYQDSSGGPTWDGPNHLTRSRTIGPRFRGYRLKSGGRELGGDRATPVVALHRGDQHLAVSVPEFWQNFPKAIEANQDGITLRLFPQQSPDPHELQGGEQKTHVFYVAFGKDTITDEPLAWTRDPIVAVVDPEWVAATGAIPYFTARAADPHREYQRLTDAAIVGDDTFETKREVIDEYGWRHFGDVYGDHEAILHEEPGAPPRVSHYNNQYDCVAGFAVQWLRSGDVRWFRQMRQLAHHVRDIDIYNTAADKAAYNHGLFWHTYHYVDADTGTHRSYPMAGRIPPHGKPVPGGGPGNEQNYAHGLMLDYFLTGDEASREAAVGLARWVIDMDDGRKTVFRWLSTADTGLASASRSPDYHGPGRGAANSVSALLDGHRLTGDRTFLAKAEQLIRRVIHPADDVTRLVGTARAGKVLVDAENRWFYVMFLQALGKYLDHKADLGELDGRYAYARASLLHYARWMADHEYPYLDHPELLEYPTETWPAQDLRKSDVFDLATLHTTGAERGRFRERAEFFYRTAIETLAGMPTRTLCRPVVLLMTQGWGRAWFAAHPEAVRPAPEVEATDFGRPTVFVPQKVIALRRAKRLVAAVGVVSVIGVIGLAVRLALG